MQHAQGALLPLLRDAAMAQHCDQERHQSQQYQCGREWAEPYRRGRICRTDVQRHVAFVGLQPQRLPGVRLDARVHAGQRHLRLEGIQTEVCGAVRIACALVVPLVARGDLHLQALALVHLPLMQRGGQHRQQQHGHHSAQAPQPPITQQRAQFLGSYCGDHGAGASSTPRACCR